MRRRAASGILLRTRRSRILRVAAGLCYGGRLTRRAADGLYGGLETARLIRNPRLLYATKLHPGLAAPLCKS